MSIKEEGITFDTGKSDSREETEREPSNGSTETSIVDDPRQQDASSNEEVASGAEEGLMIDDDPREQDDSSIKEVASAAPCAEKKYTIDNFELLKVLGKGSFGKVLLAELKGHGMHFAIKCLKKDIVLKDDDVKGMMIEKKVLKLGTSHPFMCKLFCTFQTPSYLCFVMEFLNGGDLLFHIQQQTFEVNRARFYAAEIVSALKFLHRKEIIYRDMKLENVILDAEGHIHLIDFGMAKMGLSSNTCCGTHEYLPPEIIQRRLYNQSVDWWSFGVVLYKMLVGRSPFTGTDEKKLFRSICYEEPTYPRALPEDALDILRNLLKKSPKERLGMQSSPAGNIEEHNFFKSIDWMLLEKKEVQPPFKPTVMSASDARNFEERFTSEPPTFSPVESSILAPIDQDPFNGFSYTNPHI